MTSEDGRHETRRQPPAKPRALLFADHPNLIAMEKLNGRSITPAHLMLLAKTRAEVIYARVFSDHARMHGSRLIRDWETAGWHIEYCRRYGRPTEEIAEDEHKTPTKESVDVSLIEYARHLTELVRPDEVILVAGDSDYVPLVKSLVHEIGAGVRVFLTAPCGLMEPLLQANVLLEAYTLFDAETPLEVSAIPLYTRISIQWRDKYVLSPADQRELDRFSEALAVCATCGESVPMGLWKIHPCHEETGAPEPDMAAAPAEPAADTVLQVAAEKTETAAGSERELGQTRPTTAADKLVSLREQTNAIPRGDIQAIVTALRSASSNVALAWLADDERITRTPDEIHALKRLIEKRADCAVVVWQRTLLRVRDELVEPLPLDELERRLNGWAGAAYFEDASGLLFEAEVIQATLDGRAARGSLIHPAFRFAGHSLLQTAIP